MSAIAGGYNHLTFKGANSEVAWTYMTAIWKQQKQHIWIKKIKYPRAQLATDEGVRVR